MTEPRMTPNQIVAYNLQRMRKQRGWTQDKAAERLEPHLGERWSRATFSAAERSVAGDRIRQFTADDLVAFAATFAVPVGRFLMPPPDATTIGAPGATEPITAEDLAAHVLEAPTAGSKRSPSPIDLRAEARYEEKRAEIWESGETPPAKSGMAEALGGITTVLRNPRDEALKARARAEVLVEQAERLEES